MGLRSAAPPPTPTPPPSLCYLLAVQGEHLPAESRAPSGFIVVQQGCFSFGLKSFLDPSKHANMWVCVSVRVCMCVVLHYAQMAGVEVVVASEKTKRTLKVSCSSVSNSLSLSFFLSAGAPSSVAAETDRKKERRQQIQLLPLQDGTLSSIQAK